MRNSMRVLDRRSQGRARHTLQLGAVPGEETVRALPRCVVLALACLCLAWPGAALETQAIAPSATERSVTFHRDVEPLLQKNCQACHRDGGANYGGMIAPMPLLTYEQTRPWAKSIARQAQAGTMPPWHASEEQSGHFANERRLSDKQVQTLAVWAQTGAERGDAQDAPEQVVWPDLAGWTIGEPDLILEMPEAYFVGDDVEDEYKYFEHKLSELELPEDRWIRAFEFRPGSSAVHHIILNPIGGIAPGSDATVYEKGLGRKLGKGSKLVWEMHYHKEPGQGSGVWDKSRLALKFYDRDDHVSFPIRDAELGNYTFKIPPGAPDYSVSSMHRFSRDSKIISFAPHMHLRGSAAKYEAVFPDGRTQTLLEVPRYDFNWQTTYRYREPLAVPRGTQLTVTTTWDNSAANPSNPDPTQTVRFGEPTTDEMSFGFVEFVHAKPVAAKNRQPAPKQSSRQTRADGREVWTHSELGLEFEIPDGLFEVKETESLVTFTSAMEIPQIDLDAEEVGFALTDEQVGEFMEMALSTFGQDVSVREIGQMELRDGVEATEVVLDWTLDGFPLTSLVAAVQRDQLVTVSVTNMRGTPLAELRQAAQGLRLIGD